MEVSPSELEAPVLGTLESGEEDFDAYLSSRPASRYASRGKVWPTNTRLGGYAPIISWRGARPAQQNGPRFAFRLCPPLINH